MDNNKFVGGLAVVFVAMIATTAVARTERDNKNEVIEQSARTFLVTYPSKKTEKILVQYQAHLDRQMWQDGSAAKPAEGKFVDDRSCSWRVTSYVTRTPHFVSESGQLAPIGPTIKVWESDYTRKRGADNKLESLFYKTTCGDQMGSYNNEVGSARESGQAKFREVLASDSATIGEDLKEHLMAVTVKPVDK
jgi:hypothetical protein